jgi:Flp pilus assembly protein TadG
MKLQKITGRRGERGQIIIMFALALTILLLFAGLAIDFGLAYVTKAKLGKAVDAAALSGARYVGKGQATATSIAQSSFTMNYGTSTRDVTPPVPVVSYSTDSSGNTLVTVTATSTIQTYFLALLPTYQTLAVTESAEARYARAQVTMVIDRTGSMKWNDPNDFLPSAINDFAGSFDNTSDAVALVSFANDQTLDVPMMVGGFQAPIATVASGIHARFNGATFTDGALQVALAQEQLNLNLPGNVMHSVFIFTDGLANTIQVPLTCNGTSRTEIQSGTWNSGGIDTQGYVAFMSTSNTYYQTHQCNGITAYPLNINPPNGGYCAEQTDTNQSACNGTFPSTYTGTNMPLIWTNVTNDAMNRAILDTNTMRNNNIAVYAVGLYGPSGVLNDTFMCELANDPCTEYNVTNPMFNANLPVGIYVKVTDASQLLAAFQQIADAIHLRLLQ